MLIETIMPTIRTIQHNLTYIGQQLNALLSNTSLSVKTICTIIITTYILSYHETTIDLLAFMPAQIIPPACHLWRLCTYCFLELHWWEVLVDCVTVTLCGKLIEPLWSTRESIRFFVICNIGSAILTTIFYLIVFAVTTDSDWLFHVHVHGLAAYVGGVSVAVKQTIPDSLIVRLPFGRLTNRNVPLTVLMVAILLRGIRLLDDATFPLQYGGGLFISWIYLRFYQKHSNGMRGDMADTFSFANFFPNVLQPIINVISNAIYQILVKLRICKRVIRRYDLSTTPAGVAVIDAERRRQIALKALSERLNKIGNISTKKSNNDEKTTTDGMTSDVVIPIPTVEK